MIHNCKVNGCHNLTTDQVCFRHTAQIDIPEEFKIISIVTPPLNVDSSCVVCGDKVLFEDLLICQTAEEAKALGNIPITTRHALCADCLSKMVKNECPVCRRPLRGKLVTQEVKARIQSEIDKNTMKQADYTRYQPLYRDYPNFNISMDYYGLEPDKIRELIDAELAELITNLGVDLERYPHMLPREITEQISREGRILH